MIIQEGLYKVNLIKTILLKDNFITTVGLLRIQVEVLRDFPQIVDHWRINYILTHSLEDLWPVMNLFFLFPRALLHAQSME